MSHDATAWAVKQRGISPSAKVVLFQLCDRYHPDHGCFPSKETLAHDCEMSVRSVYNQLKALEAAGLIEIRTEVRQRANQTYTSNNYRIAYELVADLGPSAKFAVGKSVQEPSANSGKSRRQNLPTNLVKEPVKEPVNAREQKFEEFWKAYPSRPNPNKAQARKVWLKITKTNDPAQIIEAAKQFAKEREREDERFTPMASTWLNQERFQDYDTTPPPFDGYTLRDSQRNDLWYGKIPRKYNRFWDASGMSRKEFLLHMCEVYNLPDHAAHIKETL